MRVWGRPYDTAPTHTKCEAAFFTCSNYWVSGYKSRSGRYYLVWDSETGVERDRFDLFVEGTTRGAQGTM